LKRDAGTFTFTSGTICFVKPIEGKVTGAVFSGDGKFSLVPPTASERKSLSYLTKTDRMDEEFHDLGLRFGDDTYDVIKKASGVSTASSGCAAGTLDDMLSVEKSKLHTNITSRLLEDVLNKDEQGAFFAFIKGKKYNSKLVYAIDPHGLSYFGQAPDEVALFTYDDNKSGAWASFHLESEYKPGPRVRHTGWMRVKAEDLDLALEKSGKLTATATTTLNSAVDGLRVVPLRLYPTLRVSAVTLGDGTPVNFTQEDKNDDNDFSVILPKALAKGDSVALKIAYSGKDAIHNEGSGNYYVSDGARVSWYPNNERDDYADFTMRFTYPKDLKLVATGKPVSEKLENGMNVAVWKSEQPLTMACFQFGKFKEQQKTIKAPGDFTVETYANTEMPDAIRSLQHDVEDDFSGDRNASHLTGYAFGNFNTTSMAQKAMGEAELSIPLYNEYFGPTPFTRIAITQQTALDYGQSFPGLVWLPMSSFYDSTVRHQLGMDEIKGAYFTVVGPHEIAHQWWAHTVTWASYRDQWMSEGFSDFSASLFLQAIDRTNKRFIKFWNDERDLLTERNKEGFRAIDASPLVMGYRAGNSKTGFDITRRLIYPKGAYILHMVRMMMFSSKDGDAQFKAMMHDFVKTYYNKAASTEDFKAMVEKHMTPSMDVTGDHKMDWFFDPFVYGTTLPNYKFTYNFTNGTQGPVMDISINQSNVSNDFKMIVPVYLELANGRVIKLGSTLVAGNTTKSEKVDLGAMGLKEAPKKVYINYFDDVLSTSN
jgi:hypothetical protein